MRKTFPIMISLCALMLCSYTCSDKDSSDTGGTEILCGGFTEQRELTKEDIALFNKVVTSKDTLYAPLSVATQVVAGLNYKFKCSYEVGGKKSSSDCYITIYQPLQGEPEILRIEK